MMFFFRSYRSVLYGQRHRVEEEDLVVENGHLAGLEGTGGVLAQGKI